MRLAFTDPRNLTLSPLNMHHGRPDPDIADILPSVRQRGVLLTLLVLESVVDGAVVPDRFEIVAGRRRWKAALAAIAEGVEIDPVPIGILEPGDDAGALEASLIENLGRLPPDEVTCWETFTRLVAAGRTVEQIAATFGLSEVVVRRTLALGHLLPRIRNLYRREEIDVATVRSLTLASKAQQKAWLALLDDPGQRAHRSLAQGLAVRRRDHPDQACALPAGRLPRPDPGGPVRRGELLRRVRPVLALPERGDRRPPRGPPGRRLGGRRDP
ncbi:ParB N-terminal domain-containing protein [Phenylobacterium sp. J367]|uniref:ParB/RepB/Spo0J family partition protein n=1 Tax=Phenylobacterium sp. J367 TaxID=2898435 RepID=UPI0021507DE0|nr:ParB N-terminal domain-containing protein [Phenylobacterium sp. J367]MCR5879450.1 ParB N-terminal domain-containing protein [Phenylobacterium sp. J367]